MSQQNYTHLISNKINQPNSSVNSINKSQQIKLGILLKTTNKQIKWSSNHTKNTQEIDIKLKK